MILDILKTFLVISHKNEVRRSSRCLNSLILKHDNFFFSLKEPIDLPDVLDSFQHTEPSRNKLLEVVFEAAQELSENPVSMSSATSFPSSLSSFSQSQFLSFTLSLSPLSEDIHILCTHAPTHNSPLKITSHDLLVLVLILKMAGENRRESISYIDEQDITFPHVLSTRRHESRPGGETEGKGCLFKIV